MLFRSNTSTDPQTVTYESCNKDTESYSTVTVTLASEEKLCVCAQYGSVISDSTEVVITGGTVSCYSLGNSCGSCGYPCAMPAITFDGLVTSQCPCETYKWSVAYLPMYADHIEWIIPTGAEIVEQTETSITLLLKEPTLGTISAYAVSACGNTSDAVSLAVNILPCCSAFDMYIANNTPIGDTGEINDVVGDLGPEYAPTTFPILPNNYLEATWVSGPTVTNIKVQVKTLTLEKSYIHLYINCQFVDCIEVPGGSRDFLAIFTGPYNYGAGSGNKFEIFYNTTPCPTII